MLIVPITNREFEIYALSLERGPNFEPFVLASCWKSQNAACAGAVLSLMGGTTFGTLALRRREDHCWGLTHDGGPFSSEEDALADLTLALRPTDPPEPLPPGARRRPLLLDTGKRIAGGNFKILTETLTHFPALMTIGEAYLALPRPDKNFVSDIQTDNFDTRLWELYLLAAFREQDVLVSQKHPSPDFLLERAGRKCWVEAVTANAPEGRAQGYTMPTHAPDDHQERLLGAPAVRFAKTIRSKLQRNYHKMPHVAGMPFAIAIADFHAPSSMVWSREALPSYLFGSYAHIVDGPEGKRAVEKGVEVLLGKDGIPSGLFRDPSMAHLSAVIFSNAATFSKFNRMGLLAGWRVPGLKMVREGILFDGTPGALEPIPFELDVLSKEYGELWPDGEMWCQEIDVFHNPLATNPMPFDLLPGATHWFEQDGEVICNTIWKNCVLSSVTHLSIERSD